ncbi:hypothetical protein [Tautonia sociabilis]|uniref:Uncharacterized protein n=1 Tax=Tautonia sociabilis TaxID=2080755 RepID=A0A432ML20_9BACT|nr:hypothetical protein [Tautonia sociabilis]RUL87778.1 hypothetical protein TsocGM_10470 [Tautonia sociabilis]
MDRKSELLYVILDDSGLCRIVRDQATERAEGLPSLLADGWRPVRETPFNAAQGTTPTVLILLERDGKGRGGDFGFA